MASPAHPPSVICFAQFELDVASGELRKSGIPLKLHPQPFQVLQLLAGRPKQIVTREEIRTALWGGNTFVDFERGINSCVNQLRATLGDDPEKPRFVETLPRRGYRFIAVVTNGMSQRTANVVPLSVSPECDNGSRQTAHASGIPFVLLPSTLNPPKTWNVKTAIVALVVFGILVAAAIYYFRAPAKLTEKHSVILADFTNTTGDEVFDDTLRQGLSIQLEQSPLLNLISDRKVNETLKLMGRPAGDRLTPEVTREVCQRTSSRAMLTESIVGLGSQYVIGLTAVDCNTGDVLAEAQEQAAGKEAVLKALDNAAVSLRSKLGESLSSVQRYATPLEEATTPSLQALQAYSLGLKTLNTKGPIASLPFFERAADLDPKFAVAYALMGSVYAEEGDFALAELNAQKAYELREKVSDREKLFIDSHYYTFLGELEEAARVYEVWQKTYPQDAFPYTDLGVIYSVQGWYEAAGEQYRVALRLEPSAGYNYLNLGENYAQLNRLDEAEATYKQAEDQRIGEDWLPQMRYELAFLKGDTGEMARAAAIAAGNPSAAWVLLSMQADTEAWYGRIRSAREFTRRAVESAEQHHNREVAAAYRAYSGLREAEFGYPQRARADAVAALKLTPNRTVEVIAALALARAGDAAQGLRVVDKLKADARTETMMDRYWFPSVHAAVELSRGAGGNAIELLQVTRPYELGADGKLYPIYVRGQGYLRAENGTEAVEEFQKILSHPGLVLNFHLGVLAHLQLGRAYALQGNTGKSRAAYQDFFTLWKDADPDIPILKEAKAEYAKLQ
jgi:DNA-binding winged helix-turn-helix (wHTH) protein/tetratricopeptide (TPR) repeat protein